MPGANLTIDHCDLKFASSDHLYDYWQFKDVPEYDDKNQVGIVILPGGHVSVKDSKLEGLDDCNSSSPTDRFMWDGIVVKGNNKADRNTREQGSIDFSNSIVKDARMGTIADDMTRMFSESTVNTPASSPEYAGITSCSRYLAYGSYGGGIINADNTTWRDCRFSVNYQPHYGTNSLTDVYNNCHFISTTDGMGDPCFYAGPNGKRLPGSTMMGPRDKVSIVNTEFSCDPSFPPNQWPTSIYAIDAGFSVQKSNFSNLGIGIWATFGAGMGIRPIAIQAIHSLWQATE